MSSLHPSDRHMHHHDGSHRWGGGPADPVEHAAYVADLRAHVEEHQARLRAPRAGQRLRPVTGQC